MSRGRRRRFCLIFDGSMKGRKMKIEMMSTSHDQLGRTGL